MQFRIQKVADEGTREPFYARLWLGIFELRDYALSAKLRSNKIDAVRHDFDVLYEPVLDAMSASRTATKNIQQLILNHQRKLSEGKIIRSQAHTLEISESISKPLRNEIITFLVNGVIAIKDTQKVVEQFDVNIGCLFTKQANFKRGISKLKVEGCTSLAEFLCDVRSAWSENFISRRDSIEHNGWVLPQVEYRLVAPQRVEIIEPQIDGMLVSCYSKEMLDRIISFVENCIVYAFKVIMKPPLVIVEIPSTQRDPDCPRRFKLDFKRPEILEWDIQYSERDFT
jgi:hypothetical protein